MLGIANSKREEVNKVCGNHHAEKYVQQYFLLHVQGFEVIFDYYVARDEKSEYECGNECCIGREERGY